MFTKEELQEIKVALNTIIGNRIQYRLFVAEGVRCKDNEKYLKQDYSILEKVLNEIEMHGNE
ncbi:MULTISPECIES: hypothetical protein [unclassified Clostridium]|uniref:hypothetical protein n=1 Tax=unclassified Clostridium TaxID=2614128 RepID=UPI002079CBE9|nr:MULTISPECIES: hypothetical protein [unclassified Clostridium]